LSVFQLPLVGVVHQPGAVKAMAAAEAPVIKFKRSRSCFSSEYAWTNGWIMYIWFMLRAGLFYGVILSV